MNVAHANAQFTQYETSSFHRNREVLAVARGFGRAAAEPPRNSADWEAAVNKLLDWFNHPGELQDEGLAPPSRELIKYVLGRITAWRRAGEPAAPTGIAPTGDGGIVLSRREGEWYFELEFDVDGCAEFFVFFGPRLVARHVLGGGFD